METTVTVRLYSTDGGQTIDDQIGAAHARIGFPVFVNIARGNNSTSLHLSKREAAQLSDALRHALAVGVQP